MSNWSWKEGVVFAFAGKLLPIDETHNTYEMSFGEKLGSKILTPLYRILELMSKNIRLPLAICMFTLLGALILGLVFYNVPVFILFGKLFPTWLLRFVFFLYIELNLFAMGCRAYARFNNKVLVDLWKRGRLVAVLPGDYEIKK